MGIFDNYRRRKKNRILKEAIAEGLVVPSRIRLDRGEHIQARRGDYTLANSELIFSAVSRTQSR